MHVYVSLHECVFVCECMYLCATVRVCACDVKGREERIGKVE